MEEPTKFDDNYLRCKKCQCEGGGVGTILSMVTISIQQPGPNIPIARMIRCCRCGWVERVYLLPGDKSIATGKVGPSNADQAGLTLRHVAECVRQAPLHSYTIDELKSGKLRGFDVKPAEKGNYNPNEWTEPEAVF